jgi:outer membrane lipoprotein-sorting protein
MRRLILAMLLCLPGAAVADTATAPHVTELMQQLSQVKSARAHFVERKFMQMLSQPLESSGTLSYTAPDKLSKITTAPAPEQFTIDGDTLTIVRNNGQETHTVSLRDYPEMGALVEGIRAALEGNIQALTAYYTVTFQGDMKSWVLLLQPTNPRVQSLVQYVRLTGSGSVLKGVETLETDGDRSEMTITQDHP